MIELYEYYVSRFDPTTARQEESLSNVETHTITSTHALTHARTHETVTEGLVFPVHKEPNAEIDEDTRFYRKNLQKRLGISFIAATTQKDRNLRPLVNFEKTRL